jgi:hypothetical protein
MSVMGIEAAIGVVQDRNETPHEWDWELAEAAMVAVKEIATLKARVAELEGLGPLIEEYAGEVYDSGNFTDHATRNACEAQADRIKARIDAILKGGAP